MEHVTLGSFGDVFTWHTLVEVVAIILATFVVHPITSAIKSAFQSLSQKRAASSKRRALRKIKKLLDYFRMIAADIDAINAEPYRAVLRTSSETLEVLMLVALAVICGELLPSLGLPILAYAYAVYYRITSRREDTINFFGEFSCRTRRQVLELRAAADDDLQLAAWWRSYFEEEPPFENATLESGDHDEPAQKS